MALPPKRTRSVENQAEPANQKYTPAPTQLAQPHSRRAVTNRQPTRPIMEFGCRQSRRSRKLTRHSGAII
jgi:hypothetical protein